MLLFRLFYDIPKKITGTKICIILYVNRNPSEPSDTEKGGIIAWII